MILPLLVDKTKDGNMVRRFEYGESGYIENVEFNLVLTPCRDGVHISYYGEDDTWLEEEKVKYILKNIDKF